MARPPPTLPVLLLSSRSVSPLQGMQLGIDEQLVSLLGKWSPIPVTYAGGARTLVRGRGILKEGVMSGLWHYLRHS